MGPTGATGPAGPAGTVGTLATQIVVGSSEVQSAGSTTMNVEARCPLGEHILGGGYTTTVDIGVGILLVSPLTVIENRPFRVPFDNNRWLVSAINLDARAFPAGVLPGPTRF